jgi:hypothetical protein
LKGIEGEIRKAGRPEKRQGRNLEGGKAGNEEGKEPGITWLDAVEALACSI